MTCNVPKTALGLGGKSKSEEDKKQLKYGQLTEDSNENTATPNQK